MSFVEREKVSLALTDLAAGLPQVLWGALVPLRRKRRAFSVDADNTGPALLISFHVSSFRMRREMK